MAYINYHSWSWASDYCKFRQRHWEYDIELMRNFSGFSLLLMLPWFGIHVIINHPHWNWDAHDRFVRDWQFSFMWKMNNPIEDGGLIYKHCFHRKWWPRSYEPEIVDHARVS